MFRFTMSATMLKEILLAISPKGHIFVIPSNEGITFTNSTEEDDTSTYVLVPAKELESFSYTRGEEDAYCFMVNEISPLISRITGDVTVAFDEEVLGQTSYIHIKAQNGKFEGRTTLNDEETRTVTLDFGDIKSESRYHKTINIGGNLYVIPVPMFEIGEVKGFKFKNPFKPLIVFTDEIEVMITEAQFHEKLQTITSVHNYYEDFTFSENLSENFVGSNAIRINTTSDYIEQVIKKHNSPVNSMILIELEGMDIDYNVIFLSSKKVGEKFYYTSTVLSNRINEIE